MKIIVVRHGSDRPVPDGERELTEYGRRTIAERADEIQQIIDGLPSALWSGPAKRARETADVLGRCLSPPCPLPVGIDDCLSEQGGIEGLETAITVLAEPAGTSVLVAHNPSISQYYMRYAPDEDEDDWMIGYGNALVVTLDAARRVDNVARLRPLASTSH